MRTLARAALITFLALAAFILLPACAISNSDGSAASSTTADAPPEVFTGPVYVLFQTTKGEIAVELDPMRAPVSVANFLGYADRGDYNNTIFYRVIPGFVVQGGGYGIDFVERKGQAPIVNEWTNGLKNTRGTIGMARDSAPDTATREFYFNCADNARLDTAREKTGNAGYAVFGHIVRGMDVLDIIRTAPTSPRPDVDMHDVPVEPVIVISVTRVSPQRALAAR